MNKNYTLLEFDKVLLKFCKNIYLEKSIDRLQNTEIIKDIRLLEEEFKILDDAVNMYKFDNDFDLENLEPLDEIFDNLKILGNYITVKDLYHLHKNIKIYLTSKKRVKNVKEKYKSLYSIFSEDIDLTEVNSILDDILDEDKIKDSASITLRDIRYQKTNILSNIKDKINDIFNNKDMQKAVSEHITTTRNDRIVISVKSDFKYLVKGIEHDKSSSGGTVYIEPINIVSLNNKLHEYEAREREEIRKILLRVSEKLRQRKELLYKMYDVLVYLDILNSKVIYFNENNCSIPIIKKNPSLKVLNARHPLIDSSKVVPISFDLACDEKNVMLITGPNTGGKTIALKTAGLLTLMALIGFPILASDKTEVGMFDNILVDIGDEQSIEQNLSSFSAHVTSISRIIDNATNKSLVIMDEIGSGTDPIEGSSFAMAVIDYLKEKNVKVMVSTHYSELKHHSINDFNIQTASMEFDLNTLMPTYKLIVGIPGESNALIIASKYGIKETIINRAKSYVKDENKKIDSIIIDLKNQTKELEIARNEIFRIKEANEKLKKEYQQNIEELEKEKNKIIEDSRKQADEYMKNMQNKVKSLMQKIDSENQNKKELQNIQKSINMIRESIKEDKNENINKDVIKKVDIKYSVGDEVLVKTINQTAKVLKLIPSKNSLQVQAGILKMIVNLDDVRELPKSTTKKVSIKSKADFKETKSEIDLRGMIFEDAVIELERFLDKAILQNYSKVYIIHGKGTMVLRKKIIEYLKTQKYIKSYYNATPQEGGLGCTIVEL